MRILHFLGIGVLPKDPGAVATGGTERVALELARVQAARGYQVTVAARETRPWRGRWRGVNLRHLPVAKGVKGGVQLPLAAMTWLGGYDVVHLHEHTRSDFLRARAVVVQAHNDFDGDAGSKEFDTAARRFWTGARRTHAQLGVSRYVANRFLAGLQALNAAPSAGNVGVCPNGVDLEHYRGAEGDRAALRQAWGFGPDDVAFLYAGVIHPAKGIDALVAAFTEVARRQPRARLVLAGGAALWKDEADPGRGQRYEADVIARLQPLIDDGRVKMLGLTAHRDMPSVFAAADVLVLPSVVQEAFGLVVVEGFASGRPAVASRIGGLVEIVAPDRNGVLVPPGDAAALAQSMNALVERPDYRAQLSRGAKLSAAAFTWEASVDRLDAIYQAALEGARLPAPLSGDGMLDALSHALDMGS